MNQSKLTVHQWGTPAAPPLLLLHGFMGSGRDWQQLAQTLVTTHFVIAPDLPGHGGSLFDNLELFTMAATAQLVVNTLDEHKIERCFSAGYSMGGRLALYLAVHYPRRFRPIILESASPGLRTAQERAARRAWDEQIARRLETEPLSAFLESWYGMPLFASFRAHPNFEQSFERRLINVPSQLALSMRMMGTGSMPSLWKAWGQVEDAMLIVGELDEKYMAISAEMAQLNPSATRHVIPHTGHNTHFEAPAPFLSLLQSHLHNNSL